MGVWYWRPTVWWNPRAGVGPEERDWLEENYPGWNDTYGRMAGVVTQNILDARMDQTMPATLPIVCNLCQIPIVGVPGPAWSGHTGVRDHYLDHDGRRYHFCSAECRWVFTVEPSRYAGHLTLVDRLLAGQIQPPDLGWPRSTWGWPQARWATTPRGTRGLRRFDLWPQVPGPGRERPDQTLFPLISNVEGDFVLQLLPVDTDDTMDQVAEKAAFHSIRRRVAPIADGAFLRVRDQGSTTPFASDLTVAGTGLVPMACIEVFAG